MLAASYYEGRKDGAVVRTLVIEGIDAGSRSEIESIAVKDKRDARKLAASKCAKPWNF